MSNRCNACGGIIGRDCFNPIECEQITRSLENCPVQDANQLTIQADIRINQYGCIRMFFDNGSSVVLKMADDTLNVLKRSPMDRVDPKNKVPHFGFKAYKGKLVLENPHSDDLPF